jgi:Tfp pilus assembly protein PilN
MQRVNLIPRERLRRRALRLRLRRWTTACAGYALFLLISLVVSHVVATGDDRTLRAELMAATSEKLASTRAISDMQIEREGAIEALEANFAVGNQPDWGILLALVAETTGDEVVLRECSAGRDGGVRRPGGAVVVPTGRDDEATTITLRGIGHSQEEVSSFLLRMEQIPLFRQVRLHDTKREPFLDDYAVGFRLECDLEATGGPTP